MHPSHNTTVDYDPEEYTMCLICLRCECHGGLGNPCEPEYKFEEF